MAAQQVDRPAGYALHILVDRGFPIVFNGQGSSTVACVCLKFHMACAYRQRSDVTRSFWLWSAFAVSSPRRIHFLVSDYIN